MAIDAPTSHDVTSGGLDASPRSRSAAAAIPEAKGSHTGVSTSSAHWYALRTTYGREKKAYLYIIGANGTAFYPTRQVTRLVKGRIETSEASLLPNMFFAYGTEEELKGFVYDNVHLPFLRFYYRHYHVGGTIEKEPLIVPDAQLESLRLICESEDENVILSKENIRKFEKGQLVRVTDGKFKGVVGRVARYRGQQRVGLVIDGLLSAITAYVPSAFLERIDRDRRSR